VSVNTEIAVSILAAVGVVTLLGAIGVYLMIGIAWQDYQASENNRDSLASNRSGYTLFQRALARRCPACGRGEISRSILQMNTNCPTCGVTFWRSEGEWMGPSVINYGAAFGGALATWAVLVMLECSAVVQLVGSAAAAIVAVLIITPWSRSFWTLFLFLNGEVR
jgi:uncharacterized protein (DUF983 family)